MDFLIKEVQDYGNISDTIKTTLQEPKKLAIAAANWRANPGFTDWLGHLASAMGRYQCRNFEARPAGRLSADGDHQLQLDF